LVNTNTAITITLPPPTLSRYLKIKDYVGLAVVNNIIINGGGANIDNSPIYTISINYGFVSLRSNGIDWFVV
jgi:hypothetical protein